MRMASRPTPRSHRVRVENDIIKRREKQFVHDQLWTGQKNYYEFWEKQNTKFDEWTSPRYFESNNRLIDKVKAKREREEKLEKRREKLRKLYMDDEKQYEVELMVKKMRSKTYPRTPRSDEVPMEVLKELNQGLRIEEEDRKRHEAELKLYHQWRSSNPVLKHYERIQSCRDLKMSWLDQQIEKRMRKEKEEEECRKLLKEREELLKIEKLKYEEEQQKMKNKKEELRLNLEKQIEDLKQKNDLSEKLRKKEDEDRRKKLELDEIQSKLIEEERKKSERECALHNIKHHKMKLKKMAEEVESNLNIENSLIRELKELEIAERIENETKKNEIKQAMTQFMVLTEEQKKLEKTRQKYLDFLFDSEAKIHYQQQKEIWTQEEAARQKLIKDVIETIQKQIDDKLEKNKQKQLEMIEERQELLKRIEDYNKELTQLKEEEEKRKRDWRKVIDDDLQLKNLRKRTQENDELKRINKELEQVRKEEERIKEEIINIQRRQGPIRPCRSRIIF